MKKTCIVFLFLSFFARVLPSGAATLNLKLYIFGYYIGGGMMQPYLLNCGSMTATGAETDTIVVELHDTVVTSTIVASVKAILLTDGTASCTFANSVIGNAYYIAANNLNCIQTWSAVPVMMSATTSYDFSSAQTQAYGSNQIETADPGIWSFFSGDINQDGNIDQLDFPALDCDISIGVSACVPTDLNGGPNVDLIQFPILDLGICSGWYSHFP